MRRQWQLYGCAIAKIILQWMNEWMNEWMNKWMNEWMNEWIIHDPFTYINFYIYCVYIWSNIKLPINVYCTPYILVIRKAYPFWDDILDVGRKFGWQVWFQIKLNFWEVICFAILGLNQTVLLSNCIKTARLKKEFYGKVEQTESIFTPSEHWIGVWTSKNSQIVPL